MYQRLQRNTERSGILWEENVEDPDLQNTMIDRRRRGEKEEQTASSFTALFTEMNFDEQMNWGREKEILSLNLILPLSKVEVT